MQTITDEPQYKHSESCIALVSTARLRSSSELPRPEGTGHLDTDQELAETCAEKQEKTLP